MCSIKGRLVGRQFYGELFVIEVPLVFYCQSPSPDWRLPKIIKRCFGFGIWFVAAIAAGKNKSAVCCWKYGCQTLVIKAYGMQSLNWITLAKNTYIINLHLDRLISSFWDTFYLLFSTQYICFESVNASSDLYLAFICLIWYKCAIKRFILH